MSKSRINLGTTNFLILVLLLLFLRTRLPMAGGTLPLIVTFAGSMAVLVTVQLLASLAVANLVSRRDEPPYKLVEPLHGVMGKILCLSNLPLLGQVSSICFEKAEILRARKMKQEGAKGSTNNRREHKEEGASRRRREMMRRKCKG